MPEQREQHVPQAELSKKGGRKPVQLVLSPEDHIKTYVTPEIAKRPTPKRNQRVKKALNEATYSQFARPNPLERRGR